MAYAESAVATLILKAGSLDTEIPPDRSPHLQAFAPGRAMQINLHYILYP